MRLGLGEEVAKQQRTRNDILPLSSSYYIQPYIFFSPMRKNKVSHSTKFVHILNLLPLPQRSKRKRAIH
jgi:hypothetical protein